MAKEPKEPPPEVDCAEFLKSLNIRLQPKQQQLLEAMEAIGEVPTVFGYGGSRGSAKSGGLRRIAISLGLRHPGIVIYIIRRVLGDLIENHQQKIALEFPAIDGLYRRQAHEYPLPNGSRIVFVYAETRFDVDRVSYGPECTFLFIDQAEQFSEDELISFRICNRWPGMPQGFVKTCLFFNVGKGVGAGYLRRIFHTHAYRPGQEDPKDYGFIQGYGWDNYEWFRDQVPYSAEEFYQLSSEARFTLFITKTSEGKKMNALPKHRREGELLGNFDSFSGQYFSDVWGSHCVLDSAIVSRLVQPWWTCWMAQKWGFGENDCHLWAAAGLVLPEEWKALFGGRPDKPVEVVIVYRELLTIARAEADLANDIVSLTPQDERRRISSFWLGSESLDQQKKRGENTVGESLGAILQRNGLPTPVPADEHRVDGWRFVYACLRQAGLRERAEIDAKAIDEGPALFISSDCPLCIENIPLAVRYDKDPNDVEPRIGEWASVTDAVRYLLKSKPAARTEAPFAVRRQMALDAYSDPTSKHMAALRFQERENRRGIATRAATWRT
jgi:hypothetical protein